MRRASVRSAMGGQKRQQRDGKGVSAAGKGSLGAAAGGGKPGEAGITSFGRRRNDGRRIGLSAPDYRVPAGLAALLLLVVAPLLPAPWFRPAEPSGSQLPRTQNERVDMEGLTLLWLPTAPAPPLAEPTLPDRIERGTEPELAEPSPSLDAPQWNWSYDPLVPLQGGQPEPLLDGARLPDQLLRASISWRAAASVQRDSLWSRLDHYAFLQRSFALAHRHLWDAEARALWLERHELWLKLYGSDDDWP